MMNSAEVESLILGVLKDVNEELPDDRKINVRPDTILFGVDAELDSLALISLVVGVESAVNVRWGLDLMLADERAMSREILPFSNVQTLKAYILELGQGS